MKRWLATLSITGVLMAAVATTASADPPEGGPPPYVSFPRLERLEDIPQAQRGQFVAGPEGLTPAPLAPAVAPLSGGYLPGTVAGTNTVSGTTNTTNALDSYQGETMLASGGTRLVGGQNDIYPGNCSTTAATGTFGDCGPSASASADGGTTWARTKLTRTWGGHTYLIGFDPSVAYDGSTFFYAYGVADSGTNAPNGIVVVSSTDGTTWAPKTPVVLYTGKTSIFEDKYWIAADRSGGSYTKSLYVAWDRNKSNNQTLLVSFSRDSGGTWSAPIKVNDGTSGFERVIGAYPAVDQRNGTVYMSWHDYAKNTIFVDKSTNGGQTWGKDVAAAVTHTGFGTDIGCNGGRKMSPAHSLLVGPNGELYVVYADSVSGNGYDIFVVKSADGGASWSAPVRANDDAVGTGRHQYNPGASIDPATGQLTISFYDRRNDVNNCLSHVYATTSTDGATFTANQLVTGDGKGPYGTGQSSYDGNANGPGDYAGGATVPGTTSTGHPYYVRHVDPDTGGSGGGFEVYSSAITP